MTKELITDVVRDELIARSNFYAFISALFADPSSERFSILYEDELRQKMRSAVKYLNENTDKDKFIHLAEEVLSGLDNRKEKIYDEYISVFGHTLSKKTSPYEYERGSEEVFYKTQGLSDINAFYTVFGLEIHFKERVDHISVESEFISFLLLKELVAIDNSHGEEALGVTHDALKKFYNDHYSKWTIPFAETLVKEAKGTFYCQAGELLLKFLNAEKGNF